MDEHNVHYMSYAVAREHINKSSQKKICLPSLQQKAKAKINSMPKGARTLIRLMMAISVGNVVNNILAPIVYAQRGYKAFGGEFLLVILVIIGAFVGLSKIEQKYILEGAKNEKMHSRNK